MRIYREGDYLLLIQLCGTETPNDKRWVMYVKSGKLLKIRFLELVIASLVALAQSTRNPRFLSQELIIRN